jgi:hypothetical protein
MQRRRTPSIGGRGGDRTPKKKSNKKKKDVATRQYPIIKELRGGGGYVKDTDADTVKYGGSQRSNYTLNDSSFSSADGSQTWSSVSIEYDNYFNPDSQSSDDADSQNDTPDDNTKYENTYTSENEASETTNSREDGSESESRRSTESASVTTAQIDLALQRLHQPPDLMKKPTTEITVISKTPNEETQSKYPVPPYAPPSPAPAQEQTLISKSSTQVVTTPARTVINSTEVQLNSLKSPAVTQVPPAEATPQGEITTLTSKQHSRLPTLAEDTSTSAKSRTRQRSPGTTPDDTKLQRTGTAPTKPTKLDKISRALNFESTNPTETPPEAPNPRHKGRPKIE